MKATSRLSMSVASRHKSKRRIVISRNAFLPTCATSQSVTRCAICGKLEGIPAGGYHLIHVRGKTVREILVESNFRFLKHTYDGLSREAHLAQSSSPLLTAGALLRLPSVQTSERGRDPHHIKPDLRKRCRQRREKKFKKVEQERRQCVTPAILNLRRR